MNTLGTAKSQTPWQQVYDAHKPPRRVRGIWRRKGRLYAKLDANNGKQYFYPLHADTVPEAVSARQALKMIQKGGKLFPPAEMDLSGDKPKKTDTAIPTMTLAEAVEGYQKDRDALKTKDEATCNREDSGLALWVKKFGKMLLADMTDGTLIDFGTWRRDVVRQANKQRATQTKGGGAPRKPAHVSGRTLDLNVLAISHVRDWAKTKGHLPKTAPDLEWKQLAEKPAPDELLTPEQLDELCNAALLDPKTLELIDKRYRHLRVANAASGQYFHDYMRLMQHTGARENETTLQAWPNVTWSRIAEFDGDGGHLCRKGDRVPGKIFFPGRNAKAGGGKPAEDRWIPLHQDLEDHLKAMYERRDPSSDWMFPARRGRPGHTLRFHKQLERVKRELREKYCPDPKDADKSFWFDRVTFQWFRHYFISHAVMAGIDYKTIAYWVSHRDGGVLIGRLYGHLDTMHSEQMSDKLSAHLAARR